VVSIRKCRAFLLGLRINGNIHVGYGVCTLLVLQKKRPLTAWWTEEWRVSDCTQAPTTWALKYDGRPAGVCNELGVCLIDSFQ